MQESSELIGATSLARALNVSTRTIDRWWNDAGVAFPRPTVINRRKYWSADEVRQWREATVARSREGGAAEAA